MPVRLNCRNCDDTFVVPEELFGKRMECPTCHTVYNIPDKMAVDSQKAKKSAQYGSRRREVQSGKNEHEVVVEPPPKIDSERKVNPSSRQVDEHLDVQAALDSLQPSGRGLRFWGLIAIGCLAIVCLVGAISWVVFGGKGAVEVLEWHATRQLSVGVQKSVRPKKDNQFFLAVTLKMPQLELGQMDGEKWRSTAKLADFILLSPSGEQRPAEGARQVIVGIPEDSSMIDSMGGLLGFPFFEQLPVTVFSVAGQDPDFTSWTTVTLVWLLEGDIPDPEDDYFVCFRDGRRLPLTPENHRQNAGQSP